MMKLLLYVFCLGKTSNNHSFLFTNELIHVYHFLNAKVRWNHLPKQKTYILNLCYWCLFTMQSVKAKLMSCFVNDYCIPTTLFKTISKLKIKQKNYIFIFCFQIELWKLWSCFFQAAPLKKVWYNPRHFIIIIPEYNPRGSGGARNSRSSLSLSVVINFALVRKLRTYTLHIFHSSILICTYTH